jgi:PAS domain S-box-containing protein
MRAEQSGQLLASIITNTDDAIVSKDLSGIVTSWNKGAERMFGFAADEMIGRSITTIIRPIAKTRNLESSQHPPR